MRHSRDIELPENIKYGNDENAVLLDTIASIHTYVFQALSKISY